MESSASLSIKSNSRVLKNKKGKILLREGDDVGVYLDPEVSEVAGEVGEVGAVGQLEEQVLDLGQVHCKVNTKEIQLKTLRVIVLTEVLTMDSL